MICLSPVTIKNPKKFRMLDDMAYITVPCGKCHNCRKRRAAAWSHRLLMQEKLHTTSYFLTFTYSDENLPISQLGYPTLRKSDYQDMMKRMRYYNKEKIKYYACGEYGTETKRPHYHCIIFGASETAIDNAWTLGHIRYGEVSMSSVSYVTGYMIKDLTQLSYDGTDKEPEFSLMSKNMGANYMTPQMMDYHREHMASYVTLPGGTKTAMPRYYRDKIFDRDERAVLARTSMLDYWKDYDRKVTKAGCEQEYIRQEHERTRSIIVNSKDNVNRKKL